MRLGGKHVKIGWSEVFLGMKHVNFKLNWVLLVKKTLIWIGLGATTCKTC